MNFSIIFKLTLFLVFTFHSLQSQTTIAANDLQKDYQILEKAFKTLHPGLYRYEDKAAVESNPRLQKYQLKVLEGKWTGKLTYLNYGDDKTLVDIPCSFEGVQKGYKIATKVVYEELDKNGNPMTAKNVFAVKKGGKVLQLNGKWKVVKVEETEEELVIVGERSGTDNHRNADFRLTVRIQAGEAATWKKEVRYEGTEDFFMRNVFSFVRDK